MLATSGSAKDSYLMFTANVSSAFLGFVFTWILARGLSVSDFGIFSAASNLVFMLAPVLDIGVTSGLIKFVSSLEAKGEHGEAVKYIKAAFIVRAVITLVFALFLIIFSPIISTTFLATTDFMISVWVALILIGIFFTSFFPYMFQAQRNFLRSFFTELSYTLSRVLLGVVFLLSGITLYKALMAFAFAGLFTFAYVAITYGYSFLKVNVDKNVYSKLLRFSGWLGVNKILSSIYTRTDVLILAGLAGATVTGYYSIASRLSFFIVVLAASLSSVFSPRLSSFENKEKELAYIKKGTLLLIPITLAIVVWVIIANPFITLLFGDRYVESVRVFQYLAIAMIPFIFTAPSVSAIIYAMKKPKYIGVFTVFQAIATVILNYLFIKQYGALGPTFAMGIVNTALAIYTWVIVFRYYYSK